LSERVDQHLSKHFPDAFTAKARDWKIYFYLESLSYEQARKIEAHIKRMKSKRYIENLKRFPELTEKLIRLYQE
jgi:putative endonuclease